MIINGSLGSLLLIGVVCIRGMGRLVTTYCYTVLLPETYGARCFHSLGLLGLCLVVWWSFLPVGRTSLTSIEMGQFGI